MVDAITRPTSTQELLYQPPRSLTYTIFERVIRVLPLGMADKVKEIAIDEATRIRALGSQAARSGAYLYPLRVRNALYPPVYAQLLTFN